MCIADSLYHFRKVIFIKFWPIFINMTYNAHTLIDNSFLFEYENILYSCPKETN